MSTARMLRALPRGFAATLVLTVTLAGAAGAAALFEAPFRAYAPLGSGTRAVALGDFDGDGALDIAVGSAATNSIAILINDGHGEFALSRTVASLDGVSELIAVDLNADSELDLAVAHRHGNSISVLRGSGDGSFLTHVDYAAGSDPASLAASDVNGDGVLDLVVANTNSFTGRSISTLLGNGDATFQPTINSSMDGVSASSVAVADFDHDGRADLVTGYEGGGTFVYVMRGLGDGRFGPIEGYDSAYGPITVAAGDLNEDGNPDFVAAGYYSGNVSVHLGRGDGTFQPKLTVAAPTQGFVTLGDVDGDGHLDVVTPTAVTRGRGNGTFDAPTVFMTDFGPVSVAVGELNGDGRADLAVASSYPGTVSILIGTSDGTFGQEPPTITAQSPQGLAAADVDGNGTIDVATTSYTDHVVALHLGDGAGGFSTAIGVGGATDFSPGGIAFSDLDGNGTADLLTGDFGSISTMLGDGSGAFGPRRNFATGSGSRHLAVGDFDGDGWPDVVTTNEGSWTGPRGTFQPGTTATVLFGVGDGTLARRIDVATATGPQSVWAGDVNHDGTVDIVVGNTYAASVSVLLGNGNGTFAPHQDYPVGGSAVSLAVGDFDRDGNLDIVSANAVWLGNGDGSYRAGTPLGSLGMRWMGGDWNGDGALDLAGTRENANTVTLLMGAGDGTFAPGDIYGAGNGPQSGVVADLNNDRRADIVVPNFYGGSLSALINGGPHPVAVHGADSSTGPLLLLYAVRAGTGAARLAFSLPTSEPTSLDVYDSAGRRVLRRHLDGLPPGRHEVDLVESWAWGSGMYFARLAQGRATARTKLIIMR